MTDVFVLNKVTFIDQKIHEPRIFKTYSAAWHQMRDEFVEAIEERGIDEHEGFKLTDRKAVIWDGEYVVRWSLYGVVLHGGANE